MKIFSAVVLIEAAGVLFGCGDVRETASEKTGQLLGVPSQNDMMPSLRVQIERGTGAKMYTDCGNDIPASGGCSCAAADGFLRFSVPYDNGWECECGNNDGFEIQAMAVCVVLR